MTNKTRNETPQDMLTGTTSPAYPSLSCLVSPDSRQDCQWQVAALICDRADCVPRGSSENSMFILPRRDHSRASLTKPEMDGLDGEVQRWLHNVTPRTTRAHHSGLWIAGVV